MTETQRKSEQELKTFFELLSTNTYEQLKEKLTPEQFEQKRIWLSKSIYYRYKLRRDDQNNAMTMRDELANILEKILNNYGLTPQEFLETKGNIKIIIQKLKDKNNKYSNITTDKLLEIKNNLINKKVDLKRKTSGKMQKMLGENYNNIIKEIETTETEIRNISKELETRTEENTFISTNYKETEENHTLKEQQLEEKINNMQQSYDKTVESLEQQITELTSKLKTSTQTNEEMMNKLKEEKIKIIKSQITKKQQLKNEIIKHLLNNSYISYEAVINEISKKLDKNEFKTIMCEIKEEIPGIIKNISNKSYKLGASADNILNNYLNDKSEIIIKPTRKTLKFIVRSDIHMNIKGTYDNISKRLEPYFNISSNYQNAPIIDLGDITDTYKYYNYSDWQNGASDTISSAYQFYKNYSKVISTVPEIKHYTLIGNHDTHPFHAGVDPISIMLNYSDNIICAGVMSGNIKINNLNIGLFHGLTENNLLKSSDIITPQTEDFYEKIDELLEQYNLLLIGHYHRGKIIPNKNTVLVDEGLSKPLILTVNIEDNEIANVIIEPSYINLNNQFTKGYQIEIYNKNSDYQKTLKEQ